MTIVVKSLGHSVTLALSHFHLPPTLPSRGDVMTGIGTHTLLLTTPELGSDEYDRSATTILVFIDIL